MAYSVLPTPVTGDIISAAYWSTYLKDNFATLFPYTTSGDLAYATSSTVLARLGIGAANTILASSGTAPAYTALSTLTANVALVGSQAAGDIPYATSATAMDRLAVGAAGTILKGGTSPSYGAIVHRRQGGSSTNWQTQGTTTYTPSTAFIQMGVRSASVNTTGSVSITYPVAFSERPIITLGINGGSGACTAQVTGDSVSGFSVNLRDTITAGAITIDVNWMAVGTI